MYIQHMHVSECIRQEVASNDVFDFFSHLFFSFSITNPISLSYLRFTEGMTAGLLFSVMLVPEIVCLVQVLSMGMMIVRTIQNVDQELV